MTHCTSLFNHISLILDYKTQALLLGPSELYVQQLTQKSSHLDLAWCCCLRCWYKPLNIYTCNMSTTVFTMFHWDLRPSTMTVKPRALHFSLPDRAAGLLTFDMLELNYFRVASETVVYTSARLQVSPGNAEQVVQSSAELLHAGLIWAERDGQDEATASILPPWRHTIRDRTHQITKSRCDKPRVFESVLLPDRKASFFLRMGRMMVASMLTIDICGGVSASVPWTVINHWAITDSFKEGSSL